MKRKSREVALAILTILFFLAIISFYNNGNVNWVKTAHVKKVELIPINKVCKHKISINFTEPELIKEEKDRPQEENPEDKGENIGEDEVGDKLDDLESENPNSDTKKEDEIVVRTEEVIEDIPFELIKKESKDLQFGKERVTQQGKIGEQSTIYEITYINGKEIKREKIKSEIIKEPIHKIVLIGVKKANGFENEEGVLPTRYSYEYKDEYENRMLELINGHRIDNNLKPLILRKELSKTARYKSLSMTQLNYFGHHNPGFEDESFNYLMTGFFELGSYSTLGENLAYKSASQISPNSIDEIFLALKSSKGHNENMLYEGYEYIGVGVVFSVNSGSRFDNLPTITITHHFGGANS